MKTNQLKKALAIVSVASATVAAFCLGGCELVVDFDRTKIDAGFVDTGLIDPPDTGTVDPGPDTGAPDATDNADADAGPAADADAAPIQDAAADG